MTTESNALIPAGPKHNELACFGHSSGFALLQRQAQLLSSSSLVPEAFSIFDKNGKLKSEQDQKFATANSAIAIEMSSRIGASAIMVAQNLHVVHGRPGWSSQFTIAAINACGKFSPLRFTISDPGPEIEVECLVTEWESGRKTTRTIKEKIKDRTCTAWAIEKSTGEKLVGPPVSLTMAVKEGWYSKAGSKWKTMEDVMLRYRAASFFGRVYAPDLLMGIRPVEEIDDIIEITPEGANRTPIDIEPVVEVTENHRPQTPEQSQAKPEEPSTVNTVNAEVGEAGKKRSPSF